MEEKRLQFRVWGEIVDALKSKDLMPEATF